MKKEVREQFIIIAGNLGDGFEFYGPFDEVEHAEDYADSELRHQEYWMRSIVSPELKDDTHLAG